MTALCNQPMGRARLCDSQISGKMLLWLEPGAFQHPQASRRLEGTPELLILGKSELSTVTKQLQNGNHAESTGSPQSSGTVCWERHAASLKAKSPLSVLFQTHANWEAWWRGEPALLAGGRSELRALWAWCLPPSHRESRSKWRDFF